MADNTNISGAPFRLSWPAIFGGMFAAAGVWLLFHAFGLALGFSRLDPNNPNLMRAAGIGTGIWSIVGTFLSLLAGGFVTARSAGFLGRGNAAIHGMVLWGLTSLGGTMLIVSLVGSLAAGVAGLGASVASGGASMTQEILGVDASYMLEPVNATLTSQGKPTITEPQLRASFNDAVIRSIGRGGFERSVFIDAIAANTQLSPTEASQLFGDLERQVKARSDTAMARFSQGAERAADITGSVFWGVFAMLAVSLLASMIGTLAGVSQRQRELSQVIPSATTMTMPYSGQPGSVYR